MYLTVCVDSDYIYTVLFIIFMRTDSFAFSNTNSYRDVLLIQIRIRNNNYCGLPCKVRYPLGETKRLGWSYYDLRHFCHFSRGTFCSY